MPATIMTNSSAPPSDSDPDAPTSGDDDETVSSLEDLTETRVGDVLTSATMEMPDGKIAALAEVAADLTVAHDEIEAYKQGALSLCQSIDEAIIQYDELGDHEAVEVLKELKYTSFGVYLRIKRGDDELRGERDGEYSGYFSSEDDDA